MAENACTINEQNQIIQALLKQTGDTDNGVKRNAFINLADVCDQVAHNNCEMLVTNLAQMVESDNSDSEGSTQCIANILRKENLNQSDLILSKTQEFTYRNILKAKSETQFNLWMEIL